MTYAEMEMIREDMDERPWSMAELCNTYAHVKGVREFILSESLGINSPRDEASYIDGNISMVRQRKLMDAVFKPVKEK